MSVKSGLFLLGVITGIGVAGLSEELLGDKVVSVCQIDYTVQPKLVNCQGDYSVTVKADDFHSVSVSPNVSVKEKTPQDDGNHESPTHTPPKESNKISQR